MNNSIACALSFSEEVTAIWGGFSYALCSKNTVALPADLFDVQP